jgi:predicted dehydrogenase
MNFLLLGYGSIGKRHAAILRGMGHNVKTVDPNPEAGANWKRYTLPTQTYWDGVLDCTPPDVRAGWATQGNFGARFVEKPLGRVMYRHEPPPVMMGFCYHLDESLRAFVQIVKYANIHSLRIEGGQYLQDWHAEDYQDVKYRYRGVVTDSLPHSIYIARWILGELELMGATGGNTGRFEIDVEDHAEALLVGANGETVSLYADYLMRPRHFIIDAKAPGRRYHWEFCAKDVDKMYQRQMEAFVKLCAGGLREGHYPDLKDGIAVQRILDEIA